VLSEQRSEAVVVADHQRVDELAAQRLDLDAIRDGPKVACASRPAGLVRCLDRPHCSFLDLRPTFPIRASETAPQRRSDSNVFRSGITLQRYAPA
jgi:hypothetical protein